MKRLLTITILTAMALTSCNNAPKDGQKADGAASRAVLENIATRTSVRAYTSEPVPEEMVEQLLRAGMAAPSAMRKCSPRPLWPSSCVPRR